MANQQPQIVSIDGVEYDSKTFNEQQVMLLNHVADLDRKIASTTFQLDQLRVGREAFFKMLKEAVADHPAEAKPAEATIAE